MKNYLCIRNEGVCDYQLFTLLGASTARGNDAKIGQFGSGAKHGALTLMRMGVTPVVFLGKDELSYYTEDTTISGNVRKRLGVAYKGKKELQSILLDFGGLDWQDPHMALREYVSNAIDSGDKWAVTLVDDAVGVDGETRVYVPLNANILEYYNNISRYFLQTCDMHTVNYFRNLGGEKARIYRKGVFVGTLNETSVYHYNLPNISVDESRNVKNFEAMRSAGYYFTGEMPVKDMVAALIHGSNETMECGSVFFRTMHGMDSVRQKDIRDSWPKEYVIGCGKDTEHLEQFARNKGLQIIQRSPGFYGYWKQFVPSLDNVTTGVVNGLITRELDGYVQKRVETVISFLTAFGLITIRPKIKCFSDSSTKCFTNEGTIYVNENCDYLTIVETIGHFTGQELGRLTWLKMFERWEHAKAR